MTPVPQLYPFVCFVCRRSFKRRGVNREETACPVCGNPAIRLSRKFKPPRRGDIAQWTKVEALVKLGFRFDTIYDANGEIVRYPTNAREIPAFMTKIVHFAAQSPAAHNSRPARAVTRKPRKRKA